MYIWMSCYRRNDNISQQAACQVHEDERKRPRKGQNCVWDCVPDRPSPHEVTNTKDRASCIASFNKSTVWLHGNAAHWSLFYRRSRESAVYQNFFSDHLVKVKLLSINILMLQLILEFEIKRMSCKIFKSKTFCSSGEKQFLEEALVSVWTRLIEETWRGNHDEV